MHPTPVGMRCPECARERTKVINPNVERSLFEAAPVTTVLIALNVIAFVAEMVTGGGASGLSRSIQGAVLENGVFAGFFVAGGEWWRIVTSGFLHLGLIHIGMNMLLLFFLGRMLEPAIGGLRFGLIYATALVGGSLGSLLLEPTVSAAGASGAVFGLMGAVFVTMRARGINPFDEGIGGLIVLNLLITFAVPGIAKGGHLGGLVVGAIVGFLLAELDERRRIFGRNPAPAAVLATVIGVALFIATILIAQDKFPEAQFLL